MGNAQRRIKWTDQHISTASKMWSDGKTTSQIALFFGVGRSTISGLISRNREHFELKETTQPVNIESEWSSEQIKTLVALWDQGKSLRQMAELSGLSYPTLKHGVYNRYRNHFPGRARKSLNDARTATKYVGDESVAHIEKDASKRYDFTQYQIEGTEPVAYWKLDYDQCHFPLERFEAVSGPETPCCGQGVIEGRAYCRNHWKLMHEVRAK